MVKEFNNIKEIIYNSAKCYKENIAFTIKHKNGKEVKYEDVTYKRLLEDINRLGTALYSLGYKGKRIAVIGKNRYEWVIAHLCNLLGGIVSIPLDKDLQYDELENSLIRSEADAIFFDEKLEERIASIKMSGKTNLKDCFCMSKKEGYKSTEELLKLGEELIADGNKEYINSNIDDNAMNILLFTSGTTSMAKAVMLSQKNIASNVYALQSVEDINSSDINIAFLPFHHIFGSTCLLMFLACGGKTVFPDGLKYIKQNLQEYGVTAFVGVPVLMEAMYKTIMKEIEKQKKKELIKMATRLSQMLLKCHVDIRRKIFKQIIGALGGKLRFVIIGGAPADKEVLQAFDNFGIKTLQGYGLSETSPVIAAENPNKTRNGSVGIAMPNVKLEIIDKDENGVGQIRVKGPNVMLGYYKMEDVTNEVLKDGWFYTGDLAYMDDDGFIFITGRSKNLIVLKNGKKVFPEELETLINRIECIDESMVFGMPDKLNENDLKLSVKVTYNKDEIKEKYGELEEYEIYQIIWEKIKELNQTFPKYKHIKNLIITDKELIKTTTKKVKRQEEMKLILENNK